MRLRSELVALAWLLTGCGSAAPERVAEPASSAVEPQPVATPMLQTPEAEPTVPEAEPRAREAASLGSDTPPLSPPMSPDARGTAPACAFASISLDMRALGTSTSPEQFDFWVRGEADDVRRAAPSGVTPRMYAGPGGHVDAIFDAPTLSEALAHCEQTVTTYMADAPSLPLIGFGSAAHVITACRSCD